MQLPRAPLSPIRPLLSHHAPAPMWTVATPTGSQLPEKEEDDSSSDVTLSDTDLSSEARDDFDQSKGSLAGLVPRPPLIGRGRAWEQG